MGWVGSADPTYTLLVCFPLQTPSRCPGEISELRNLCGFPRLESTRLFGSPAGSTPLLCAIRLQTFPGIPEQVPPAPTIEATRTLGRLARGRPLIARPIETSDLALQTFPAPFALRFYELFYDGHAISDCFT